MDVGQVLVARWLGVGSEVGRRPGRTKVGLDASLSGSAGTEMLGRDLKKIYF